MKKPNIKVLSSEEKYSSRSMTLIEEKIELPSGIISTHITLKHIGAVVVLPVFENGDFLLIKQYRHSVGDVILELPAGTLSIGESPEICSLRELSEETGYCAKSLTNLGTLYPTPGFCSEIQYLFLAKDLFEMKNLGDEDEIIEPIRFSSNQLKEAIASGLIMDGKSMATILRALAMNLISL